MNNLHPETQEFLDIYSQAWTYLAGKLLGGLSGNILKEDIPALVSAVNGGMVAVDKNQLWLKAPISKGEQTGIGSAPGTTGIPSQSPGSQSAPEPPKMNESGGKSGQAPPAPPAEIPRGLDGTPLPAFDKNKPGWIYCPICFSPKIVHEKKSGKGTYTACYEDGCRVWLNIEKGQGKVKKMDE